MGIGRVDRRSLLSSVVVMATLALTVLALSRPGEESPDQGRAIDDAHPADGDHHGTRLQQGGQGVARAEQGGSRSLYGGQAGAPADSVLLVCDARTRAPVLGAVLVRAPEAVGRSLPTPLTEIARSNDEGRIRIPHAESGALMVKASGYVLHEVPTERRSYTALLERASTFDVQCVDLDGAPVSDANVVLCAKPVAWPRGAAGRQSGDPRCPAASWTGQTDEDGRLTIGGLPPGSYRLVVWHDAMYTAERAALGNTDFDVSRSTSHRVVLWPIHAVVFGLPEASDASHVLSHTLRISGESLRGGIVGKIRRETEVRLAETFPGAIVRVDLPMGPEAALAAHVEALLADGSRCVADCVTRDLREWKRPVQMVTTERVAMRRILPVIMHAGRRIDGIPLQVSVQGRAEWMTTSAGGELLVPCGTCELLTPYGMPGFTRWIRTKFAVPPGEDPMELPLEVPVPLQEVRLEPSFAGGAFDAPVYLAVHHHPSGDSTVIPRWHPEMAPPVFWMPEGEVRVSAAAFGYQDVEKRLSIRPGPSSAPIRIRLDLRLQ